MKHKMSRMEGNKEVRRVLARHGTDLSNCSYSCTGTDVRITGSLKRSDGNDFEVKQVEIMVQEMLRHMPGFSITGDMDNWSFNESHITFLGGGGGAEASEDQEDAA